MLRVPVATYRIQFNAGFRFEDAQKIVAYLSELGITDLYASPLLRARKGSTHGYDIVDAMSLNPELGSNDDFEALSGELQSRDMGMMLDIVPNHMAASHENAWWNSVLENGQQSRFVHYFDIDWRDNKVLLPILGRPYGDTLAKHELQLGFDAEGFYLSYYETRLPINPQSYTIVLEECIGALPAEGAAIEVRDLVQNDAVIANSRFLKDTLWRVHEQSEAFRAALAGVIARFNKDVDLLDRLIAAQNYRIAYWRIAAETINYRRFFDVTDLVGLRVENPEVFELRNRLIFDLIAEGKFTGLRVDHIDGLYDPANYLAKLAHRLADADVPGEPFYVVVEKILEHGESLPQSFQCAGTTGYDFLSTANTLFIDPAGLERITAEYQAYTGMTWSWEDLVYEKKKQVIDQLFYGEMRALGAHLGNLAVADRNARDFSPTELVAALIEITACLPVYRTYVREAPVSGDDRDCIRRAVTEARRRAPGVDARLFNFLEFVLLLEPPRYIADQTDAWLAFVMDWQQFTGRVMAKGVEDTAFYNYNRLISLNEVGGEPGRGGDFDPVAELHERNDRIAREWPHTMNATSTHDTKRSEDVRARISVLSEIPDEWRRHVKKWTKLNAPLRAEKVPDANEEWLLYQTLIGVWPLNDAQLDSVPERLTQFLEKAAREAKTHSSWLAPDADYENALKSFATGILQNEEFMRSFTRFQKRVAFHGFLNSLSQVVLKVTSPGVPDFYQGSETWDFSLVDPDNRRTVDYERRVAALEKISTPAKLLAEWRSGSVKLFVTARSLAARAQNLDAFTSGDYAAIDTGTENAVAYMRGKKVLVVLPRLTTRLVRPPRLPLGDVWGEHAIDARGRWRNVFTDEIVEGERIALRDLFATFPVAVLERT